MFAVEAAGAAAAAGALVAMAIPAMELDWPRTFMLVNKATDRQTIRGVRILLIIGLDRSDGFKKKWV